jgi:hypothetical protein
MPLSEMEQLPANQTALRSLWNTAHLQIMGEAHLLQYFPPFV